jgi:hypothetical protein
LNFEEMMMTATDEMTTESVLAGMLKENTGRHMLDSGGAYGRNWERNQAREFESEPEATISGKWGYIDITLSTYHFLKDRLDFDAPMQALLDEFSNREDQQDNSWLATGQDFVESLRETGELSGIYGEGDYMVVNTYNHDNLLDQTLQYIYFTYEPYCPENSLDSGPYVLLHVHGGCDVRGGYSAPKMFRLSDCDGTGILYDNRASIGSENPHYNQGTLFEDGEQWKKEKYLVWDIQDGHYEAANCEPDINNYEIKELEDGESPVEGFFCVDEDGTVYCPVTARPLEVWGFPV